MAHDSKSHASKSHAPAEKTAADRLHESLETAKTKATDAVAHSREVASETAHKAATKLDANPLGVLVGGLAVGAVVGALIPRSAKEQQALAPLGRKLGETARSAISAAREAGYAELDQRGLTKSAAKDQVRGIVDGIGQAVKTAGSAAANTATHADA